MVATITRPQSTTALLEPSAPPWAQRLMLRLLGYFWPQQPRQPMTLWAVNKVDLPPASAWPNCLIVVADQNALGLSVGGVWMKLTPGGPV